MVDHRFLTITDVATILCVSPRMVRTMLHIGALHGIQVGGRGQWRVEIAEFERVTASGTRAALPS